MGKNIIIFDKIESLADCFKISRYLPQLTWKMKIVEDLPSWWGPYLVEIRNEILVEIVALISKSEYPRNKYLSMAYEQIQLYLQNNPEDKIFLNLKEKVDKILTIDTGIETLRSNKDFDKVQLLLKDILNENSEDIMAKYESDFLELAKPYLLGDILVQNKTVKDISTALDLLSELMSDSLYQKEPFRFYREDLEKAKKDLISALEDVERQTKILKLNKDIQKRLKEANYDGALELIKQNQNLVKIEGELIYSENKHEEIKRLSEDIRKAKEAKEYDKLLEFLKYKKELNPFVQKSDKDIQDVTDFLELRERFLSENDCHKLAELFRKNIKVVDSFSEEVMSIDFWEQVKDKRVTIESEIERLRRQAVDHFKNKKYMAASTCCEKALKLVLTKSMRETVATEYGYVKQIIERRRKILSLKYMAAGALVIFLIYLFIGPIPRYFNRRRFDANIFKIETFIILSKFIEATDLLKKEFKIKKDLGIDFVPSQSEKIKNAISAVISEEESRWKMAGGDDFIWELEGTGKFEIFINREIKEIDKIKLQNNIQQAHELAESAKEMFKEIDDKMKELYKDKVLQTNYKERVLQGRQLAIDKKYLDALKIYNEAKNANNNKNIKNMILEAELYEEISRILTNPDKGQVFRKYIELYNLERRSFSPFSMLKALADNGTNILLDGITFIHAPAGVFEMGCFDGENCENYEKSLGLHKVELSEFWMSETEITKNQYRVSPYDKMPATCDWNAASRFAKDIGNRYLVKSNLPTEAQWEYVARNCGQRILYPWGNSISCKNANYNECGEMLRSVKLYPSNSLGFYDMAGNVREWCRDVYYENYYDSSPIRNPCNTEISIGTATRYIVRGGCYGDSPRALKTFYRYYKFENDEDSLTGFRIVLEI